jgi:hypothetical protein
VRVRAFKGQQYTCAVYALKRLQAGSGTWYWAVHFNRKGKLHYRRFYDPKYGGSAKSRKAAVAWRDEQLATVPVLTKLEFCQQVRDNNTSGVPGVHFLTPTRQPLGIWQARLKLDGIARTKTFSVRTHGNERALQMAIEARHAMLEAADDTLYLRDKVAIRKARTSGLT